MSYIHYFLSDFVPVHFPARNPYPSLGVSEAALTIFKDNFDQERVYSVALFYASFALSMTSISLLFSKHDPLVNLISSIATAALLITYIKRGNYRNDLAVSAYDLITKNRQKEALQTLLKGANVHYSFPNDDLFTHAVVNGCDKIVGFLVSIGFYPKPQHLGQAANFETLNVLIHLKVHQSPAKRQNPSPLYMQIIKLSKCVTGDRCKMIMLLLQQKETCHPEEIPNALTLLKSCSSSDEEEDSMIEHIYCSMIRSATSIN